MALEYEELSGSPKIRGDRKSTQGTREFKVGNEHLTEFLANAVPSPSSGYGTLATLPGFPWAVCVAFDVEPFTDVVEPGDDCAAPASCEWWRVALHYDSSHENQSQGPVEGGNGQNLGGGDGPGGEQGSAGGEDVEFIEHELHIGAEFLTLPNHGVEWAEAINGSVNADNVNAGLLMPIVDHDITLANCSNVPWGAIRGAAGKVNDGGYAGAVSGSALFVGCRARRGRSRDGRPVWSLSYSISEKPGAFSWNKFYRPETGKFERLKRKGGFEDIYLATDFAALFKDLRQLP